MPADRIKRVNELLRREIGSALLQVLSGSDVDISAITVTYVSTSRDLRGAQVGVSIRDHVGDEKKVLSLVSKHRKDIQERINRNLVLKYTPRLSFRLDRSVAKGDKVLNLLASMEDDDMVEPLEPPEEE